jgi:hypothetical protein
LHLRDEVIERLRRVVPEHVAELLHEGVEVRLLPAHLLHEHVVERLHHVLHALQVARGHLFHHLGDVLEEVLRHGLPQLLHELLEAVLCLWVQELVVLQFLHLARSVRRQRLEEVALPLGDALEHLAELLLVAAGALLALAGRALFTALRPALLAGSLFPALAARSPFAGLLSATGPSLAALTCAALRGARAVALRGGRVRCAIGAL